MITGDTKSERLSEARKLFEEAQDFWTDWQSDAEEDLEFYHGDQWDYEDTQRLIEQKRPVLTYNVLQSKVNHLLGSQEDNAVDPIAMPVGADDQFLADVINQIKDQLYDSIEVDRIDGQVFEDAVVAGIGSVSIDAMPDPSDPTRLKITYDRVHPLEIMWDPASGRRDKGDAKYLSWSRWMGKSEFKVEYPDFADRADEIFARYTRGSDDWHRGGTNDTSLQSTPSNDGYMPRRSHLYFDSKRKEIRVIHLECMKPQRIVTAMDSMGNSRTIDARMRTVLSSGEDGERYTFSERWEEEVYWYEFVGEEMLFEDVSPQPFDGFSVRSFAYKSDEDNRPYGLVRLLKDAQREVNKRYSQVLHWITTQSAPGLLAEIEAVVDPQQAKESLKKAGDITWLNKGALANGRIQERSIPQFPDSVAKLQQNALAMLDLISNVHIDDMTEPRGIPEAAATTQLKHRRSLLSMKPVLREFHYFRRDVFIALMQSVVRWMSDQQIAEMIGNHERFVVKSGQITDKQTGATASIQSMRTLRTNVHLRPAESNNTQRIMDLQGLQMMGQSGIAVDPNVMFEMMGLDQSKTDRLKVFAESMKANSAKAEEENMENMRRQLDTMMQLESMDRRIKAAEVEEGARSNMANERGDQTKASMEFFTRFMDLYIKADKAEKDRMLKLVTEMAKLGFDTAGMAVELGKFKADKVAGEVQSAITGAPA